MVAMGQRQAEPAGQSQGGGDAGHHGDGNAVAFQHLDLLAGATEDHRIARFEPHHMLALLREAQHHGIDIFLLAAVARGALAHQHPPGLAAGHFEHLGRDQVIEQDHIGRLQRAHGLDGEEIGIAGSGPDQGDSARRAGFAEGIEVKIGGVGGAVAKGAFDEALPEGAALRPGGEPFHDRAAQVLRQLGPGTERCGQQRFDTAAHRLAQDRRGAGRGNADDQRRAVDDGAELELAEIGPVDDIIGHALALGGLDKGQGLCVILDIGHRHGGAREVGRRPVAIDEADRAGNGALGQSDQRIAPVFHRSQYLDMRAGRSQQLDLPGGRLGAANGDDTLVGEIEEDRQHGQRGNAGPIRRRRDDMHR